MKDIALQGIGSTSQRRRDALVNLLREKGITNEAALELVRTTPRHLFLDEAMQHNAYYNMSVPIGYKQTISQPYIVARMTGLLLDNCQSRRTVLEIGTGSGYQTSLLSQTFDQVFSVERIGPLQKKAKQILSSLSYNNVSYKLDDGHWGWSEHAPYDAIISAASPDKLPSALLEQLAIGGCLVSPVGSAASQQLICVRRDEQGFHEEAIEAVTFVPFLQGVIHE